MNPILDIQNLSKHFTLHEQGTQIPSCSDVNLTATPGQLTALVGPTGAGKSSVLKCVYRTYLPSSGGMFFTQEDGSTIDLSGASESEMLRLRERDIGFVTQFLHCLPRKAALDIVAAPLIRQGESVSRAQSEACELLRVLNVPERLWNVPPATFSGGEKQRVNLARGLIAKPRLLLLDEPTASLDPHTTDRVVDLLNSIKQQGVAMLAIFHHPALVDRLADRVVELTMAHNTTELPA
jgi:alpha-D-ribose 1-methylphosphonate 5-triphosphate synthase subunit PhnL